MQTAAASTVGNGQVGVLVVDDCPEARAAIGSAVGQVQGFGLVGSVGSGEEALDALHRVDPDLVLLDVRMPGLNGPQTCSKIRATGACSVVVLVSAHPRAELPDSVDTCGADAVLYKGDVSPRRLEALWRSVQQQRSS